MTHAAVEVLLWFTVLTFALVGVATTYRFLPVLTFKTPANSWTRGNRKWDNPDWVTRFEHAHLNCLENLPLYAAIVLAASLLGQLAVIDTLAWWYLGFRAAQSLIHVINASAVFVLARATMLVGQWALLAYWLYALLG